MTAKMDYAKRGFCQTRFALAWFGQEAFLWILWKNIWPITTASNMPIT